ncbi:hypothetical protein [Nocardia sp. NPDC050710]|uniref:hypothetical protein n=1 Tax=Nocardia sp. NPDC050710 TaxID=3157220 RepID=UPI0033F41E08
MLIATLIITTLGLLRRKLRGRTEASDQSGESNRTAGSARPSIRRFAESALRRPVPVAAAVVLFGVAVAAGTLAQC